MLCGTPLNLDRSLYVSKLFHHLQGTVNKHLHEHDSKIPEYPKQFAISKWVLESKAITVVLSSS